MKEQQIIEMEIQAAIKDLLPLIPPQIEYIYGIPKGGIEVAKRMKQIATEYHYLNFEEPTKEVTIENTLIIDEIADTGKTLLPFTELGFTTAALYKRYSISIEVTLYSYLLRNENWLIFPWERKEK